MKNYQPVVGFRLRDKDKGYVGPVAAIPGFTAWMDELHVHIKGAGGSVRKISRRMKIVVKAEKVPATMASKSLVRGMR